MGTLWAPNSLGTLVGGAPYSISTLFHLNSYFNFFLKEATNQDTLKFGI